MIRYVCNLYVRACLCVCLCVVCVCFWGRQKSTQKAFSRRKKKKKKKIYGCDWLAQIFFPGGEKGYVLIIMGRWPVMESPSLIWLRWQTIPCPQITILMGSAHCVLYGGLLGNWGWWDCVTRGRQTRMFGLINLIILTYPDVACSDS